MRTTFHFLIVLLLLLCVTSGRAQDFFDDDARFWLYLKLDKKLSKKLEAQLIVQDRFNNNIAEFSQLNVNPELSYKFNKHFKIQGGYVLGNKRKPEGFYLLRHQVYGGFIVRQQIGYFTIAYRQLVQAQTRASYNREKAMIPQYFDRNKLTLKYQLSRRVEMYLAGELNIPLSPKYPLITISRMRYFSGLEFKLNKNSYLEGYFLYQRKYLGTKGYPPRDFIYGLTYGYSF
jgi:hypothetical protein